MLDGEESITWSGSGGGGSTEPKSSHKRWFWLDKVLANDKSAIPSKISRFGASVSEMLFSKISKMFDL